MQFSISTIAAAVAFLPLIEAHLFMNMPGAYFATDNMPPLKPDGSDFPCAVPSFGAPNGTPQTLNPGQASDIKLFGTAVHSGGSCQISITYDSPPTKASIWKVMKSFEGGCPVNVQGNLPEVPGGPTTNALTPLPYTVTNGLPAGPATVAWTWFNKTGIREMYMRCMKVTIGGTGTSKDVFNKLPDMFVANAGNGCATAEGAVMFPDPGAVKAGPGGDAKPIGNCKGGSGGPATPPPTNNQPPKQVPVAPVAPVAPLAPPPVGGAGGACTNGKVTCDGKRWQSCVNGAMVDRGLLAPGTGCSAVLGYFPIPITLSYRCKQTGEHISRPTSPM
ncbi:hypothetical protein DFH27DRAFT_34314 [Peziza echinospora]|nr:hypothetical protein DFH27DRAFT_34314 [Peziza echinospora]